MQSLNCSRLPSPTHLVVDRDCGQPFGTSQPALHQIRQCCVRSHVGSASSAARSAGQAAAAAAAESSCFFQVADRSPTNQPAGWLAVFGPDALQRGDPDCRVSVDMKMRAKAEQQQLLLKSVSQQKSHLFRRRCVLCVMS